MEGKMSILVHECTFLIEGVGDDTKVYHAPKLDFSHIAEYVGPEDLVPLESEESKVKTLFHIFIDKFDIDTTDIDLEQFLKENL